MAPALATIALFRGGVRGLVMNLLSSGEALADAMARRGGDRLWNLDASAADVC